jgi:hypothetical protein
MKNSKFVRLALAAGIIFILALFSLAGMATTAYAAQSALPGDSLFVVKTGLEQTRIALTRSAIEKARLNIQFADSRLDEMLQLAEQGRYQDLDVAVAAFQTSTTRAMDALGEISIATSPVQAREMTTLVAGVLTRQSLAMSKVVASLPETVRPAMQDALATVDTNSQLLSYSKESSGGGLQYSVTVESMTDTAWVIDGFTYSLDAMTIVEGNIQVGDLVEFYIFTGADGSQTLWKVEPASSSDGTGDDMDDSMDNPGQDDGMEEDSMDSHDMQGTLEAISDGSWTIDGVSYLVDANTKIEGTIQVGDLVEFNTYTTADGSLVLAKVEPKSSDDSSGESMDDMEGDTNEDGDQSGSMYSDDGDHEYNSQPENTTPYYDSQDDDHEDNQSGQYYEDDHEDNYSQNNGSGDHSGEHDGGDHEDHDD